MAYIVKNPELLKDPVSIDVGVPSLGCQVDWPIVDGNHRFAAALYMGLEYIETEISGEVEYAKDVLGCCIR